MPNPFTLDPVIGYAVPFFLFFMGLEMVILYLEGREGYHRQDAPASIAMGLGSVVINLVMKTGAYLAFSWLYTFRLFELGYTWWSWVLLFFADDFTFYWHHRSCHEIRLFWAGHVNHHSSQHYNLAVALRQSWGELLHKYLWWLWLPLVGFLPLMILTVMSISLIYQFFLHTEVVRRLGPLEWFFNTPSHHRAHHASNLRYLDRNHGGMLIIWDRLFGTFEPEDPRELPVYGLTTNIHTYHPLHIATHAYRELWHDLKRSRGWRDRIRYALMPPGWSPDRSTLTARQMRQQANPSPPKPVSSR
ncbi:Sterol desaturase/sphingolipid hydroxylase, fatty acid hydroxylase superfamily [Catalinimonas alkaloidigena]|uniref:Sterol desaturase/sphingolipid hydroxylase, fatty acid hydroxylase superfamily n=1 Tax=Catalinimonas alkaloidigena TaxID=1075417 RepID=A0A1G9S5T9_9BACT|nr:sterol desaturase family protein [Catalinimonas alkaloidigena]SDM30761.1 Sterol desaturase/sphingolipid hydroxylase, fatty acid hydroxylase superfamily [Catalinimonas alkaloidigena]